MKCKRPWAPGRFQKKHLPQTAEQPITTRLWFHRIQAVLEPVKSRNGERGNVESSLGLFCEGGFSCPHRVVAKEIPPAAIEPTTGMLLMKYSSTIIPAPAILVSSLTTTSAEISLLRGDLSTAFSSSTGTMPTSTAADRPGMGTAATAADRSAIFHMLAWRASFFLWLMARVMLGSDSRSTCCLCLGSSRSMVSSSRGKSKSCSSWLEMRKTVGDATLLSSSP
ncbi:hypothetical protein JZ751_018616 [Albula glossodonta]|uniref:Uncharacterized protein n=1 Tax=Albula glossodonta TaxID=121402 RepID=A0A8T2MWR3_9TELE|nr:hypothetical protein JZ751_018616 [Albula glossodonta]